MFKPQAACGPDEDFVCPVWVFAAVEVAYILPTCPYFDNLEFAILMQVALSVTSSRLLPLHLGFERFQYISLS